MHVAKHLATLFSIIPRPTIARDLYVAARVDIAFLSDSVRMLLTMDRASTFESGRVIYPL
jgi:hypothetical protein